MLLLFVCLVCGIDFSNLLVFKCVGACMYVCVYVCVRGMARKCKKCEGMGGCQAERGIWELSVSEAKYCFVLF